MGSRPSPVATSPHAPTASTLAAHPHPPAHPTAAEVAGCCPFQEAIDLLSRRHAMTIIWLLQQEAGPMRFNAIKRAVDVNPVTLTQRLGELEAAGILHRQTFNETPPRVEYSLTGKGRDLVPLMDQLSNWARKHGAASEPETASA